MENAVYMALAACSGVSVFLFLLNIPLYLGKIKRNSWYGFRTPRTLSSDEIWFPANREAGLNFMIACVVILLTSLVLFLFKKYDIRANFDNCNGSCDYYFNDWGSHQKFYVFE